MTGAWDRPLGLHELIHGPVDVVLTPDANERAQAAKRLEVLGLPSLSAQVTVTPWFDGVELQGGFQAVVMQECGVSLDPFEHTVSGHIAAFAVPPGSTYALSPEGWEVTLDPDEPDLPDILEGGTVEVAAFVIEHLALTVDPFPRKPIANFDHVPPPE